MVQFSGTIIQSGDLTPDIFQELFHNSLLLLQADIQENSQDFLDNLANMIVARWTFVKTVALNSETINRFYRLGFPIKDCVAVENHRDQLLDMLKASQEYIEWGAEERLDYFLQLVTLLLDVVGAVQPKKNDAIPCLDHILKLWLFGAVPNEIVQNENVLKHTSSPSNISEMIEDLFGYKLPWAINAINAYFSSLLGEGEELPEVTAYFSSFLKYGVHSPVAASLLAFGIKSRKLALRLSEVYVGDVLDVQSVLTWLIFLGHRQLEELRFSEGEINQILHAEKRSQSAVSEFDRRDWEYTIQLRDDYKLLSLDIGQFVIVKPLPEISTHTFSIYDLWGNLISESDFGEDFPAIISQPSHGIDIRIMEIWQEDDQTMLKLGIKIV